MPAELGNRLLSSTLRPPRDRVARLPENGATALAMPAGPVVGVTVAEAPDIAVMPVLPSKVTAMVAPFKLAHGTVKVTVPETNEAGVAESGVTRPWIETLTRAASLK